MPNPLAADADVIVAGAGAIGMLTAWNLHEHGLKVVVLDQQRPFTVLPGLAAAFYVRCRRGNTRRRWMNWCAHHRCCIRR